MKTLITAIAFAGLASASANFVDDLSISGSFDYETEYVFRGHDLSDHSFQPGVEFGYGLLGGDLYTGVWSSHEISNTDDVNTEVDFYIGYAYDLTEFSLCDQTVSIPVTLDVGFTYYMFPDSVLVDRSREVYVGVSLDSLLNPALYYYYDFDKEQSVLELSVGHSVDLSEFIPVDSSLELGAYWGFVDADDVAAGQGGVDVANGYSYAGVSADVVYPLSQTASASIGVRWAINNDGDSSPVPAAAASSLSGTTNSAEDTLWFGTTLSFAK